MREQWLVFKSKLTGEELCAYTLRGTFEGELDATKKLLAGENGIPIEDISVSAEWRGHSKSKTEGRIEGKLSTLVELVNNGDISVDRAASMYGVTPGDFGLLMKCR